MGRDATRNCKVYKENEDDVMMSAAGEEEGRSGRDASPSIDWVR